MTRVKICGLSTPATMQETLDAGVDFVGLVFYPKSPRNVTLQQAAALADLARGRAEVVTLVVDADDELLRQIAGEVRPDFIQMQGKETPERVREVKDLTDIPVIKAVHVETSADVAATLAYDGVVDLMMYEPKAPKGALPGGNGLSFDWRILEKAVPPFMLAGGLNAGNVREAIRVTKASIVDVSSGVESAPGVKDVARIRKFIEAVRAAS